MSERPEERGGSDRFAADRAAYPLNDEPVLPDRSGRIPERARVVAPRGKDRHTGTIIDNQGPAYLVRFDDGAEAWYDRASIERDNPDVAQ
ncbi:MAG: hypothetical protein KY464_12760 [Gemmatimonadetes bacterium]|nr:hypothetical protein [Gemmatimonadota bacterium]